ncbi:MAG: RIP metalloprotease RseP [bacterium]
MFVTLLIFLAVLSVLVLVHELGHFLTARRFGIRGEEFGLGFPPRFLGLYKDFEGKWKVVHGNKPIDPSTYPTTIYSLNYFPLGGFVKIKGENGENVDKDSFVNKPIWQRAVVLSAGVSMNLVLAAFLFTVCFMVGTAQSLENVDPSATITERHLSIIEVQKDSPAEKSGIKAGDTLLTIDKHEFVDYEGLKGYTNKNANKELTYVVKRGNEIKDFKITPRASANNKNEVVAGIGVAEIGIVKYSWYEAPWQGIKQTAFATWAILLAFGGMIKGIFMGHGVSADVAGPVGIAALTGQVARMGFVYLMQFTALLSINLAIINFLPLPALDGGRVLFLGIEKIKGRPVKTEIETIIHTIGFALLMLLVIVVTFKDIFKFSDKFVAIWQRFF